jgi:hypothetical protein
MGVCGWKTVVRANSFDWQYALAHREAGEAVLRGSRAWWWRVRVMGDCVGEAKLPQIPGDQTSPKGWLSTLPRPRAVKFLPLRRPCAKNKSIFKLAHKINTRKQPATFIPQTPFTMGKRSRKDSRNEEQTLNGNGEAKKLNLVDEEAVDPPLALLFSSSASTPPANITISHLGNKLTAALGWTSKSTIEGSIRSPSSAHKEGASSRRIG